MKRALAHRKTYEPNQKTLCFKKCTQEIYLLQSGSLLRTKHPALTPKNLHAGVNRGLGHIRMITF